MNKHTYKAPWSKLLKASTALASIVLVATTSILFVNPNTPLPVRIPLAITGPLVVFVCALFMIRGYRLDGGAILVKRWLWETRIELSGLVSAKRVESRAMQKGAMKTCGNSGLFAYAGWWRNKALGNFRASFTNWDTLVLLTFSDQKWLVSPDDPEAFVETLKKERRLRD